MSTDAQKFAAGTTDTKVEVRSQRRMIWMRFKRHRVAVVAAIVLILLTVLVFAAPWVVRYKFDQLDMRHIREAPSSVHLLGTDDLGRDLFTRILYGGRISLSIGIFSALVGTI